MEDNTSSEGLIRIGKEVYRDVEREVFEALSKGTYSRELSKEYGGVIIEHGGKKFKFILSSEHPFKPTMVTICKDAEEFELLTYKGEAKTVAEIGEDGKSICRLAECGSIGKAKRIGSTLYWWPCDEGQNIEVQYHYRGVLVSKVIFKNETNPRTGPAIAEQIDRLTGKNMVNRVKVIKGNLYGRL